MKVPPVPDHENLLESINNIDPGIKFNLVLTRSGWYRVGGIIDSNGRRISDNLRQWAEQNYHGDIVSLNDNHAGRNWIATSLKGQTLYLTAQTGPRACDFLQLEIEKVVEVQDRQLFCRDWQADDLEEFIDPLDYPRLEPKPVGEPYYRYRRITSIADMLEKQFDEAEQASPVSRFLSDWEQTSAAQENLFHQRWVLSMTPYTDRFGEQRHMITPLSTYTDEIMEIGDQLVERGATLANLIHGFDRRLGYPMAWYFFMLHNKKVSTRLAEAIHLDLMGAYDYLPPRDIKVLYQWIARPYSI